ncbi:hypothetical protein NDA10_003960 [Ustilago hordei]|nr:hypothetical protein NDA10_003960 [Ustilago hordei]
MYCNYEQNDWADLLDTAAFVYNNTVHNSIGVSPFFACYGWNPKAHPDIPQQLGVNDPGRFEYLMDGKERCKYLQEQIREAQRRTVDQYNRKHKDIEFKSSPGTPNPEFNSRSAIGCATLFNSITGSTLSSVSTLSTATTLSDATLHPTPSPLKQSSSSPSTHSSSKRNPAPSGGSNNTCHLCNGIGHWARNCPSRRVDSLGSRPMGPKVMVVTKDPLDEASDSGDGRSGNEPEQEDMDLRPYQQHMDSNRSRGGARR